MRKAVKDAEFVQWEGSEPSKDAEAAAGGSPHPSLRFAFHSLTHFINNVLIIIAQTLVYLNIITLLPTLSFVLSVQVAWFDNLKWLRVLIALSVFLGAIGSVQQLRTNLGEHRSHVAEIILS